jgi:hypothetical protein
VSHGRGFKHEAPYQGKTNDWLTPPYIIDALGPFDLDPCASIGQPWKTADTQYTVHDDGLSKEWSGFVWLNPPYGPHAKSWVKRLADHGNGIAFLFARTETRGFVDYVWKEADSLLFIVPRMRFHHSDGTLSPAFAGAPSVLAGYGELASSRLRDSGLPGAYINEWRVRRP